METKLETVPYVGNVQLNKDVLNALESLQENSNSMLDVHSNVIGDCVCFLSLIQDYLNEDIAFKARHHVINLAHLKNELVLLKKV